MIFKCVCYVLCVCKVIDCLNEFIGILNVNNILVNLQSNAQEDAAKLPEDKSAVVDKPKKSDVKEESMHLQLIDYLLAALFCTMQKCAQLCSLLHFITLFNITNAFTKSRLKLSIL